MTHKDLAAAFDSDDKPLEAIWAYELAIQEGASLESLLDLAVLYFMLNDPGYFIAHKIDERVVDAAYLRAQEVLGIAEASFGQVPEITFWRLHMKDRVLGETMPNEVYERLASQGASPTFVALFAASQGAQYGPEARKVMHDARAGETARKRYLLSFS